MRQENVSGQMNLSEGSGSDMMAPSASLAEIIEQLHSNKSNIIIAFQLKDCAMPEEVFPLIYLQLDSHETFQL